MDDSLYFNDQRVAVREMVRAFAQSEVAPVAGKFDEAAEFPWENVKRMGELGLLGIPWPEEVGGGGRDLTRARSEVAPVAGKFDEAAEFPWENVKRMGELGLLGIPWPEEVGGAGLDLTSYMLGIHEMAA